MTKPEFSPSTPLLTWCPSTKFTPLLLATCDDLPPISPVHLPYSLSKNAISYKEPPSNAPPLLSLNAIVLRKNLLTHLLPYSLRKNLLGHLLLMPYF